MLKIDIIPALKDNYIYFLKDEETGKTAMVDPGEAKPAIDYLKDNKEDLDYIMNTHHHWDHTNGNKKLKQDFGAKIIAFKGDSDRISDIDIAVKEGDQIEIGKSQADILEIPGHTSGHIAFYFPQSMALFCGDTLFSMGCGRIFEGTPEQMWCSLKKLRALPDNTQIYCGHEYTENNGEFCLSVEPDNPFIYRRMEGVRRLRSANRPTVPTLLGLEKNTNVFLRSDQDALKKLLGVPEAEPHEVFGQLRFMKDHYS